jgi:hypothetical protein
MNDSFEIPLGDEQDRSEDWDEEEDEPEEDRFMVFEAALEIVFELAKGNALSMEEGFDVELWDEYKKQHLALDTVEDYIVNNIEDELEDHLVLTQIDTEEAMASILFEYHYDGGQRPGEQDSANLGRALLRYMVMSLEPQDFVGLKKLMRDNEQLHD